MSKEVSAAIDSGNRACGGALERGEGLVLLETGGEVLGGLRIESVLPETASEASNGARQECKHMSKGVDRRCQRLSELRGIGV